MPVSQSSKQMPHTSEPAQRSSMLTTGNFSKALSPSTSPAAAEAAAPPSHRLPPPRAKTIRFSPGRQSEEMCSSWGAPPTKTMRSPIRTSRSGFSLFHSRIAPSLMPMTVMAFEVTFTSTPSLPSSELSTITGKRQTASGASCQAPAPRRLSGDEDAEGGKDGFCREMTRSNSPLRDSWENTAPGGSLTPFTEISQSPRRICSWSPCSTFQACARPPWQTSAIFSKPLFINMLICKPSLPPSSLLSLTLMFRGPERWLWSLNRVETVDTPSLLAETPMPGRTPPRRARGGGARARTRDLGWGGGFRGLARLP
mmetsp:Transcript_147954/g.475037  ORF Transcript_147954/g.475037 Transcript_147954/m.475037 type:complete len:312 (-) Transcript_147954:2-937(-)